MDIFQVRKQAADETSYVVTYIADIEKSRKFEPVERLKNSSTVTCKYNKNSLYVPTYKEVTTKDKDGKDVTEKVLDSCKVYYSMYSSKQPFYKSATYKVPAS